MLRYIAYTLTALMVVIAQPVHAQDFPLTIAHKFGTTIIEEPPRRVGSLDFGGIDNLLALGVQPVNVRDWWGGNDYTAWSWAAPLLTSTPTVLKGDLDFEAIAAATPDVIIALYSGIDAKAYDKLSLIAPVVAVPEGIGDFTMPWDARALVTGRAIGKEDEAADQLAAIKTRLEEVAADHPDWAGKTASINTAWDQGPAAYASTDPRQQFVMSMGFVTPPAIDAALKEGGYHVVFSREDISAMDNDLALWFADEGMDPIKALPGWKYMKSTQEGRDVYLDKDMAGAFSHSSLLSLNYLIDRLVPMIEAALDGDPSTHADGRPDGM